jgi:hypothetical protein
MGSKIEIPVRWTGPRVETAKADRRSVLGAEDIQRCHTRQRNCREHDKPEKGGQLSRS